MNNKLIYIAGPCVINKPEVTYDIALALRDILAPFQDQIYFAFKASYDKANRTRHTSFRGVGLKQGLEVLASIKKDFGFKILTDVHQVCDIGTVADVVDILQVPAFLCRQTDLLTECAKTGKVINLKKGQFIAPDDVKYMVEKITDHGNENILITERGTSFGYNDLIVDMRSIPIMKQLGFPVIFDAGHAVQSSSKNGITKGSREFIPPLAKAAMACGADGLFTEVFPNPEKALCDADNSLYLSQIESLLETVLAIKEIVK